ncbi:MAG: hypothetical protein GY839_02115 [candidate division Zixibacteria bacterium]|nr:hypothetical protein [candidate division Zixibacteria bacterium]
MAKLFGKYDGGNWYITYRWHGKFIRKSTGTKSKDLAEKKMMELEVEWGVVERNPIKSCLPIQVPKNKVLLV